MAKRVEEAANGKTGKKEAKAAEGRPKRARELGLSDAYYKAIENARRVHDKHGCYSGKFLRPHSAFIASLVKEYDIESILDYGCGKGQQYNWVDPLNGQSLEELWGIEVTKYDPAVKAFSKEPTGTHDLVICTHVLGCIPPDDLPTIIKRIYSLANKAVFIAEKADMDRPPKSKKWKDAPFAFVNRTPLEWISLLTKDKPKHIALHIAFKYQSEAGVFHSRLLI